MALTVSGTPSGWMQIVVTCCIDFLFMADLLGLDELWRNEGLNSINSDKEKFYSSYR